MKEIILVLLGAIISCGTTWFLDFIKSNRDEKLHYKRKREETYLEMQDLLVDYFAHWNEVKVGRINQDLRIRYNNLRSKAHIYAKKEITDAFYDIANNIMSGEIQEDYAERNDRLIQMIKDDLKIED